jgi:hypothetical protein
MPPGLDTQMRELKHERSESGLKTALCLLAFSLAAAGFNMALYSEGFFRSESGDDLYCADLEGGKISLDLAGLSSVPFSDTNSIRVSAPVEGASAKSTELIIPSISSNCPSPEISSSISNGASDTGMSISICPEDGQPPASVILPCLSAYEVVLRGEPAGQPALAKTGAQAMSIE